MTKLLMASPLAGLVVLAGCCCGRHDAPIETDPSTDSPNLDHLEEPSPDDSNPAAVADPVAQLQVIVDAVERRAERPIKILHQIPRGRAGGIPAGGKWVRSEVEYSVQDYDVKQTDSLVNPYEAYIQISMRTKIYVDPKADFRGLSGNATDTWFDSEEEAMRATEVEYRFAEEFERDGRLRAEYEWKDGKWVSTWGGSMFPFTEELHELRGFEHHGDGVYKSDLFGIKKLYQ